jgi:hypothetical protein
VVPQGTADAIVKTSHGLIVKSIDGQDPMQWLLHNIVEVSTFALPYKSVGARMNALLQRAQKALLFGFSELGDLSGLQTEPIPVTYANEHGTSLKTSNWQWQVYITTEGTGCGADGSCLQRTLSDMLTSASASGSYASQLDSAMQFLQQDLGKELLNVSNFSGVMVEDMGKQPLRRLFADGAMDSVTAASNVSAMHWIIEPVNGSDTYGYWAIQEDSAGRKYVVLKLTSFMLCKAYGHVIPPELDLCTGDAAEIAVRDLFDESWAALVKEASAQNVTRLLVDWVGNGGGDVDLAWDFVRWMMPEVSFPEIMGENDRPMGDAFEKYREMNLLPLIMFGEIEAWKNDRAQQVRSDPDRLQNLTVNILKLLQVAKDLDLLDEAELEDTAQLIRSGQIKATFDHLSNQIRHLDPFRTNLEFDAYQYPQKVQRGRQFKTFTAKYVVYPLSNRSHRNPFTDTLFLSDGLCGSSCYIAAGTSYVLARKYRKSIRMISFGGVGGSTEYARKTLSATSFPGGNVENDGVNEVFKPILKWSMLAASLANLAGLDDMLPVLGNFVEYIISIVPYWANQLPGFTQSEMFQPSIGKDALPAEYIFMPIDIYLPQWYYNVGGTRPTWDSAALANMHQAAAEAFQQ